MSTESHRDDIGQTHDEMTASGHTGDADPTAAPTAAPGAASERPAPAEATELIDPVDEGRAEEATHSADAPETVPSEASATADGRAPESTKKSRKQMLEAEGDVAADFLEGLLDICDIDGDIDVDIDGDRAAVSIVDSEEGRVPRRLVGPDGKVLEALQELTRLAVQSETGERSRLMLDVAGHRAARRAEIVEIARGVIAEVTSNGHQVEMEPMTAFERKIVHDEVLAAGLRSESDGVEPRRFVVVLPAT